MINPRLHKLIGQPLFILAFYGLFIVLNELILNARQLFFGVALYGCMMFLVIVHATLIFDQPAHKLTVSLVLIPLSRLLAYSMPLLGFPPFLWYFILPIPILMAINLYTHTFKITAADIGFAAELPATQALFGLTGFVFGLVAFLLLRPKPLTMNFNPVDLFVLIPAVVFIAAWLEEVIYRGVIARAVYDVAGRRGIAVMTLIYGALFIAQSATPLYLLFVIVVAAIYFTFALSTRSTLGCTLSHSFLNLMCYIILPILVHR